MIVRRRAGGQHKLSSCSYLGPVRRDSEDRSPSQTPMSIKARVGDRGFPAPGFKPATSPGFLSYGEADGGGSGRIEGIARNETERLSEQERLGKD